MICTVPPTRYPLVSLIANASATIPCPANAASPCNKSGKTLYERGGSILSCADRTMPNTIGPTVSRWLGFADNSIGSEPPFGEAKTPTLPR